MGWASWIADAGSCDKLLVTSWFPVLYAWYAPMSSGAAGSMNDAARFVRTLSQHAVQPTPGAEGDRKSTRLNSSHRCISYAVFCLKKKKRLLGVGRILEVTCG